MKKTIKKLALSKSTVNNMSLENIRKVKGGALYLPSEYPCPSQFVCASDDGGCYTFRLSCRYACSGDVNCTTAGQLCDNSQNSFCNPF